MGLTLEAPAPFAAFAETLIPQTALRERITTACRRGEAACVGDLLAVAQGSPQEAERSTALATRLVQALRRRGRAGGAEGLLDEYALSSQEGIALMCLAEALLRIPDDATRDALIRDKIAAGDWQAHLGQSPSVFVNAATWGLLITGRLTATSSEAGLSGAITRAIGRGGEPVIRRAVAMAMRLMGEQFVTGQTIEEALSRARRAEARGFRYSYDMLGEAATTMADADRYFAEYEHAIEAIGAAAAGRGIYEGPGISVKLSALHPRYGRAQRSRVMAELLPQLKALAVRARRFDIGLNIDAEESDRLEISLDLLEALCTDPDLAGWSGVGFVIQAYGKRCPLVIDWLIDLARRSRRRIMVRLVKGAYWDAEIKRAQIDGLSDFPVFTRKLHTDVSYLACARKLLAAPAELYPQFATHNAQTLAAIHSMAGANYYAGQYEFQCLHGMGEPLYDEVVGPDRLNRPCRIYAPVGTHQTLLAYLVRRLLENGANTSFVNRVVDPGIPIGELVADPVQLVQAMQPIGAPHPAIALPSALFGDERANSRGLDLASEQELAALAAAMRRGVAAPASAGTRAVTNPADRADLVGRITEAGPAEIAQAVSRAVGSAPAAGRAPCLRRAADMLEQRRGGLIGLMVREAGKTLPAAVAELREAVDFLRYYAARATLADPLGAVVCISPWNFPLAIFTGQVAAALAAGNSVLAKPAEQTPLIAAAMVDILHESGIPAEALQIVHGDGRVGAALVADRRIGGVVFTGSTEVARQIGRTLAGRVPLIAETGGQNAMIVDSSALAEQVVGDVLASAFDSAGQRCSALRILCLQDEVADRILAMLRGAMQELAIGNPDRLATDIGPVIDEEARENICRHIDTMRARGFRVSAVALPDAARLGSFVAPTLIEIDRVADVEREVFGPVLHVLRYARAGLDGLIDDINATGYGLTFGLHTRIDETIAHVTGRIRAGNIYVNRNIVGAVVGVQPFGGEGLSGTGPKAGGPLYLARLGARAELGGRPDPVAELYRAWCTRRGSAGLMAGLSGGQGVDGAWGHAPAGVRLALPGPVGETNLYLTLPLGRVLCVAQSPDEALRQIGAALAGGNHVLLHGPALPADLPAAVAARITVVEDWRAAAAEAALVEGDAAEAAAMFPRVQAGAYDARWLVKEQVITTNTAAAGGNASLMAVG